MVRAEPSVRMSSKRWLETVNICHFMSHMETRYLFVLTFVPYGSTIKHLSIKKQNKQAEIDFSWSSYTTLHSILYSHRKWLLYKHFSFQESESNHRTV